MKHFIKFPFFLTAFTAFSQQNTEVLLFDLNTQNEEFELSNFKNISNNDGYDNQPSFLDDNTILYAGTRNGQTDIVKYNLTYGSKTWVCFTEGGEYSPLKIPNQNAVSAIRLDPDGKQLLYRYDLKNGKNSPLMDTLVVGYHTWFDKNTVVSSVLEADYLALYVSNVTSHKNQKMDDNIGRSLHKIPNTELVSYISKKMDSTWVVKSLNPLTGETKLITKTLPLIEDMCWLSDGSILMAKDGILFRYQTKTDPTWKEVARLKDFGIKNITRLAVSPDGKKLAVVGEPLNQKLEPKLENIKWIAGNWKGEAFGGQTEENWSEPSGGSMMATFKLIDKGQIAFYEIEIIREVENSLILQLKHFDNDLKGWETKDETVDFPLKEITANKVIFEGMTFEKVSDIEMNVYVDIHKKDGSIETVKFNYKK
ncbi:MAG: DUF6265 family protein [Gelidibacter sp.]